MKYKHPDIVNHIATQLIELKDIDVDLLRFIPSIATKVMAGQETLQIKKSQLNGLIINVVWKVATKQAVSFVVNQLTEAIEKNKGLKDENSVSKSEPENKMEPGTSTL